MFIEIVLVAISLLFGNYFRKFPNHLVSSLEIPNSEENESCNTKTNNILRHKPS